MKMSDEEQQARFTAGFYYSSLYNALVLFAATPQYLESLCGPGFDPPFEMESEIDYAFGDFVFNENFKNGKVAERLRGDLLVFKSEVDALPNELWRWEEILSNSKWNAVRTNAERLLVMLGEERRTYDFDFTTTFEV